MIPNSLTLTIPLQADEHGLIRVSGTRVTLDTIIARYHQGDTPETIHEGFDVLPITDIYTVIADYLGRRDELDAYLKRCQDEADRIHQEIEANSPHNAPFMSDCAYWQRKNAANENVDALCSR
jgi:uncharacterized protein (DUF433 family)